jgi:hypothetical protein
MQLNRLYTEENFKNQDLSQVICSICSDVIFDPIASANCSHIYCKECIEVVYKNDNKCPQCRIELKMQNNKLFEVLFINNLIYACNNKDCNEFFKVGNMCYNIIDHKKVCQTESTECPRCKENIVRKEMDNHKNKTACTDAYISALEKEVKYLKEKYVDKPIGKYICDYDSGINIRQYPDIFALSMGVIKKAEIIYSTNIIGNFLEIDHNGTKGYILKYYQGKDIVIKVS